MNKILKETKKYKLKPVRKVFGNKIKYPDGPPIKTLEASHKLGFLSKGELNILLKIKESKTISTEDRQNRKVIQKLHKRGFLDQI